MKRKNSLMLSLMVAVGMYTGARAQTNVAVLAEAKVSGWGEQNLSGLSDGLTPTEQGNVRRQASGGQAPRIRPRTQMWVEYQWKQPVSTKEIALYWWNYNEVIRLPEAYRITYWDGQQYTPVKNPKGLEKANKQYNRTSFDEIKTTRIRLELDSADRGISTLLEWAVYKTDNSPAPAPVVTAGDDRDVMVGGKTYLAATYKSVVPVKGVKWRKVSGPGEVIFSDMSSKDATATFSRQGDYVLEFSVTDGQLSGASSLLVKAHEPPPQKRLDVVYTTKYKINSPLWNDRAKAMIVNWIPYCIAQCERTDLTEGQGGLDNFIEAAKALRGEPHERHKGYVFSNAWVHQTVESMCIALMVDPQGDQEIIAAQQKMKLTLEKWIPIILAAQEENGYLHTAYTLRDTARWKEPWSPQHRGDHEGYVAGYFIESAINHYTLTEGKDRRLYDAAKKLADCWVSHIGPGKKEWYDGHQEMEQALVRFGRFVNDMEGSGHGDSYVALAKFLLDSRKDGSEYDQSHVPVQQQYEAVGHAVRATYNYSAMSDVAAETGDVDYQSAVMSLWNNMVNKKYYITGGIGSGETSEGFGPNYSLRNNAYCESCSSAGLIFFEHKMNLAYHDAKYADLYEETMYNALLGALDLEGKNFYYTNELSSSRPRNAWHVCPCCVGNIPRTLLMVPTWTYVTGDQGIYVNMYIGSTVQVDKVAGTQVEMVQDTEYPWKGTVDITVNPKESRPFTVFVRAPDRTTSELYTPDKTIKGLKSLSVNGQPVPIKIENGYVAITRSWKAGDKINLEMPMEVQQFTSIDKIVTNKGLVAFRYGPLIYNIEKADQSDIDKTIGKDPFIPEWRGDLLNGVMTIKGTWSDGSPFTAIPNYARNNRVGQVAQPTGFTQPTQAAEPPQAVGGRRPSSVVWVKKEE